MEIEQERNETRNEDDALLAAMMKFYKNRFMEVELADWIQEQPDMVQRVSDLEAQGKIRITKIWRQGISDYERRTLKEEYPNIEKIIAHLTPRGANAIDEYKSKQKATAKNVRQTTLKNGLKIDVRWGENYMIQFGDIRGLRIILENHWFPFCMQNPDLRTVRACQRSVRKLLSLRFTELTEEDKSKIITALGARATEPADPYPYGVGKKRKKATLGAEIA